MYIFNYKKKSNWLNVYITIQIRKIKIHFLLWYQKLMNCDKVIVIYWPVSHPATNAQTPTSKWLPSLSLRLDIGGTKNWSKWLQAGGLLGEEWANPSSKDKPLTFETLPVPCSCSSEHTVLMQKVIQSMQHKARAILWLKIGLHFMQRILKEHLIKWSALTVYLASMYLKIILYQDKSSQKCDRLGFLRTDWLCMVTKMAANRTANALVQHFLVDSMSSCHVFLTHYQLHSELGAVSWKVCIDKI